MNIEVINPAPVIADIETETPAIETVGVVGAGQMGNGIAHVCALAGLPVMMLDVKRDALDRALATMARNMDRQVAKQTITEDEKRPPSPASPPPPTTLRSATVISSSRRRPRRRR